MHTYAIVGYACRHAPALIHAFMWQMGINVHTGVHAQALINVRMYADTNADADADMVNMYLHISLERLPAHAYRFL